MANENKGEKKDKIEVSDIRERPFAAERLNPIRERIQPSSPLDNVTPVSYYDENNSEGELREGRVDVAGDMAALREKQAAEEAERRREADRQFIKRGMARQNDPLATSTATLENNYRKSIRDAHKNEVVVGVTHGYERGNKSLDHTLQTIEASKAAEQEAMKREDEKKLRHNEAMLAIYDGVASTKALLDGMDVSNPYYANNRNYVFDYTENPVIGQDENGKAIYGNPTAVPGMKVKRAFLQPEIIESINKRLKEKGNNNFEILDVRAEQNFSEKTGSNAGDPTFIVTGQTYDPKTKKWVTGEKKLSLKDLYNIGVKRGVGVGLDKDVAENNVISVLGDIYGRIKPSEKERIEMMKQRGLNAREMFKAQNAKNNANPTLKDMVSTVTQLQQYFQEQGANMQEEKQNQMRQAIDAIWSKIASMYLPQQAAANPGGTGGQGNGTGGGQPKRGEAGYIWKDQNGKWWRVVQVGDKKGKEPVSPPKE